MLPCCGGNKQRVTAAQMAELAEFIKGVPLFRHLDAAEHKAIAAGMHKVQYKKGDNIFKQGDHGDAFYVIQNGFAGVLVSPAAFIKVNDTVVLATELIFSGKTVPPGTTARVDKYDANRDYPYTIRLQGSQYDGQRGRVMPDEIALKEGNPEAVHVATLKAGDYFGEQALIYGKPRNATIKATEDLACAVIDSKVFNKLDLGSKLNFAKRNALQAHDGERKTGVDREKSEAEQDMIRKGIQRNAKLTEVVHLDDAHLDAMVEAAYRQRCEPGDIVIRQGDIHAEEFYVIAGGKFEVSLDRIPETTDQKVHASEIVGTLTDGESFGELALLYQASRAATVTCKTAGTLFVIDRYTFKDMLRGTNEAKHDAYIKILDDIHLFDCLLREEKDALASSLVETNYILGETVIREGEQGDAFYILKKGQIAFTKKDEKGEEKVVSHMDSGKPGKGCYFGERSLLKPEKRAATVRVTSQEAVALALDKARFDDLVGPLAELLKQAENGATREGKKGVEPGKPRDMKTIKQADMKRLALLGCGGFGAVTLEQNKVSGECYALKRLSKGHIVKTKMQAGTMREKNILAMCDSPFVIKLFATFQDDQYLFFVLEPAMGGELYATYHKYRFHGDVKKAKFYSATVVFCFEHLHERNILYRDLKPENLLLDHNGMCKITDMGLAKVSVGKTFTTCGTPDYFAPEVVQQAGMSRGVDWWTLGVLTHELMSGHAPFEANDPMETYQKIVRGVSRVRFTYRDAECVDYVKNMLKHQPAERLPMRVGGTKNIKQHAWYADFDWDALFVQKITPPFKPPVKGPTDASNFRASEADLPPVIEYVDDGSGWSNDF
mmetsp:Transcript_19463/g.48763  ORF Transcript_19463/g.48763 Transcript_19463/m.48763 type:complete len:836 (-) Transcript_19463:646-3153(-)|eukprot:CAMPEP_0178992360 /NCGR_PEP_ID=MMETSP0795-20121207/6068_1 /TAXON_ID=88552 /ORGANISM="Amoebophrya sp., Strain Ameob2" /LENGTH=835 /DNA_ID=CAMNT_0020684227 /DNA_START=245 /DNA_END=2752 /DNA_ORIENTATION=+